jgi:hypothetical protein
LRLPWRHRSAHAPSGTVSPSSCSPFWCWGARNSTANVINFETAADLILRFPYLFIEISKLMRPAFTPRWIYIPFKGCLVRFRVVECRTRTSTTGTSMEKKLSGRPWEKASTLLLICFWIIGFGVAFMFCF